MTKERQEPEDQEEDEVDTNNPKYKGPDQTPNPRKPYWESGNYGRYDHYGYPTDGRGSDYAG